MAKIDPEMLQLARYIDSESHQQLGMTAIVDDEERRQRVSDFIKRRLHQEGKSKETTPQRMLRKSAMQECLDAIKQREEKCYCPTTLILATTHKMKGLCNPCQRARDALNFWIDVERLVNARLQIQRDYFTAICSANKDVANPPLPAEPLPLEPGNVIAALEAKKAMDNENNARNAAQKTG